MLSVSVCSCWAITCCANSSRRDVDQSPALSVPDLFVSFRCLLNKLASLRHSNLNKGLSTLRDVLAVVPETAPASLLVTSHLVYSAAATAAADRNNDGPAFDHAACCQNSKDAGAEVHQHQAWATNTGQLNTTANVPGPATSRSRGRSLWPCLSVAWCRPLLRPRTPKNPKLLMLGSIGFAIQLSTFGLCQMMV